MKNDDNQRLLSHKRQVDEQRKAKAIMRRRALGARAAQGMERMLNAPRKGVTS